MVHAVYNRGINIITRRASTEGLEFRQDLTFGDMGKFQSKLNLRTLKNVNTLPSVLQGIELMVGGDSASISPIL